MKNLVLLFLFLGFASKTYSCSCYQYNREKAIQNADLVITGKIISRDIVKAREDDSRHVTEMVKFKVVILEKYKGKSKRDTIDIYTGSGGGDCGYIFQVGKVYTIFTGKLKLRLADKFRAKKIPYTSICTRTNFYDENEAREIAKYCKVSGYS